MPIDWTHIGLLISCSALLVPVKRSAFLDMRPIAVDQLLEQMSDAILVIDKRLRVVDCNRAALANLGLMQAPLGHTLPVVLARFLGPDSPMDSAIAGRSHSCWRCFSKKAAATGSWSSCSRRCAITTGGSRRWERRTTHQALAGFSSGVI
jgi:PAS domain-containing protein